MATFTIIIPVLEMITSAAHRFLKTGDPVDCAILDGRASQASLSDQRPGAGRGETDQL
jgi:hypothetical protein